MSVSSVVVWFVSSAAIAAVTCLVSLLSCRLVSGKARHRVP